MKIPMKLADSEEMLTFKAAFKFPPVNVGGEKDHSKLENLDYANSGHTGFASSEDIPTKVSQLENDKGYIDNSVSNLVNYELKGKTGTNLGVSIDNTTYVMTIELKNTAGDVISTGSVDLPLESMVIGASYDDSTKEIVLTLQSGEEVRFSVADLVSGLVSQSTFDTKMNEISQEFNHKFDMPYYYEYNGDTDFEDTSETTLAMFNEIKELMEAGQKPCIIVKKGATGANSYITYHFIVPQFGSLDTTYIMLKGSPVRKDGSTFNLVALNCEKDPATNQIKKVYEKKADGSITIESPNIYIWDGTLNDTSKLIFKEAIKSAYDETLQSTKIYYKGHEILPPYLWKGLGIAFFASNIIANSTWKQNQYITFTISYDKNTFEPTEFFQTPKYSKTQIYDITQNQTPAQIYRSGMGTDDLDTATLGVKNTAKFTPTTDYHPSTKLYTDQRVQSIAPDYNATSTYKVGDYVSYQGKFYKCTTAIETAEAWNSEHWSETTVKDEMGIFRIDDGDTNEIKLKKLNKWFVKWRANEPTMLVYKLGSQSYIYAGNKYYGWGVLEMSFMAVSDGLSGWEEKYGITYSVFRTAMLKTHYDEQTYTINVIYEFATYTNLPISFSTTKGYPLGTNNTSSYTPTADYQPATKKYVDDKLTTITGYDATKTQTLKNINGVLTWQTDGE